VQHNQPNNAISGRTSSAPDRQNRSTARALGTHGFAAAGYRGRVVNRDFDRRTTWNRFAGRDRDVARRRFHDGFVGWIGPVFWPYAADDVMDYALWPYDYAPLVYAYGMDDIYEGIFWPNAGEDAAAYGDDRATRRAGSGYERSASAPTQDFSRACGTDEAAGIADWPIRQIAQTVEPTDQQRPLLDELAAAGAKAAEIIKAACPRQTPMTPTGRLAAMEIRLAAMREAVDIVRPALGKLYDLLDDEQKARFNAMGKPEGDQGTGVLARTCAEQAARVPQWPVDQIARTLRLNKEQRAGLEALRTAATQAADMLKTSCPTEPPATPPGRLDAITRRLDTMLQALKATSERLGDFYSSLSDEQKARFNTIGPVASRNPS
jgi:hypothetical protein